MKNTKNKNTNKNPKKMRRQAKSALQRELTVEEILQLHNAAVLTNAPSTANTILNMRGGITEAEAEALLLFARIESVAREMGKVPTTGDFITGETRFI